MERVSKARDHIVPLKITTKLTTLPRSRLLIFFYKNLLQVDEIMGGETLGLTNLKDNDEEELEEEWAPPEEKHIELRDSFKNCYSYVNCRKIDTVKQMLEMIYIGQRHNKDEGDYMAGLLAMFNKIAKQELLMKECRKDHLGWSTEIPEDGYKSHEFNVAPPILMGRRARRFIQQKYGIKYSRLFSITLSQTSYHTLSHISAE
jgi:hypothetical protein